jgi:hypothetical protein
MIFYITLVMSFSAGLMAEPIHSVSWCPASACASKATEVDRWECAGEHLFGSLSSDSQPPGKGFVFHSCWGIGWGNAIRGLYNAGSLALMEGRKLMVIQ